MRETGLLFREFRILSGILSFIKNIASLYLKILALFDQIATPFCA